MDESKAVSSPSTRFRLRLLSAPLMPRLLVEIVVRTSSSNRGKGGKERAHSMCLSVINPRSQPFSVLSVSTSFSRTATRSLNSLASISSACSRCFFLTRKRALAAVFRRRLSSSIARRFRSSSLRPLGSIPSGNGRATSLAAGVDASLLLEAATDDDDPALAMPAALAGVPEVLAAGTATAALDEARFLRAGPEVPAAFLLAVLAARDARAGEGAAAAAATGAAAGVDAAVISAGERVAGSR